MSGNHEHMGEHHDNGSFASMSRLKRSIIGLILAAIPVGIAVATVYQDYHTRHVISTVTPILNEHTRVVEGRIDIAQNIASETQRKVDSLTTKVSSLQVSAAIAAVAAIQTELDRHEREQENTEPWRRERDRLKRQVEQSKEYRQCLIEQRLNCELLRGW